MLEKLLDAGSKLCDRRLLIGAGLYGAVALPSVINHPAFASGFASHKLGSFKVSFRNQHTGESFSGVYRVGDRYLPEAFEQINTVLRDFRTGEVFPIDPRIIDIVYAVHQETGKNAPFEVLSGYRSPKTNAMLRASSGGVAKNSLHMTGQAIDLRMPGFSTRKLRDIARTLRAGGVGYYSRSDFIHMDTGRVRFW